MDMVIELLKKHISNQNIHFVFPSQTAAGLWALKTCTLGINRSVAAKRFLAWDRFKEEIVNVNTAGKMPVNTVMRKLFAEALIRKNAEAVLSGSGSFLRELIPPEYAEGGKIFAPYISRLLPSLASYENLVNRAGIGAPGLGADPDPSDLDLRFIKSEYAAFLELFCLYEPSWEEIKITENNIQYILFFPELIEDFAEYDLLLPPPKFIKISADEIPFKGELVLYQSVREEIRSAVMEIRKLNEEGIPYEEMAVSVPELEELEPWLLREFALKELPFTSRAGKKLGETGVGRFFSLVNECASMGFSFNSLKALLLNDHVPWREREKNKALIRFGIKHNCVSSYVNRGKLVDIWEEAFGEIAGNSEARTLQPYYRELKKQILSLASSKNFKEIRNHYFAFRGGDYSENSLLDMKLISKEDDAILARCIEELNSIIELEDIYLEHGYKDLSLIPASPYGFFLGCLEETEYVMANQSPGVSIFKWRVAASSPFKCHFVLNASQSASTVLYQPMKFLRQDKRKALGIEDRDASAAFFTLSQCGGYTRISASTQTFSGWAIPHSFFAQGKINPAEPSPTGPYEEERRFWREGLLPGKRPEGGPEKIFPLQKTSFEEWKNVLLSKVNHFSFFNSVYDKKGSPEDQAGDLIKKALPGMDGLLRVSATGDLNVYYECSIKWLHKRIFRLDEFSLEAELLDDISLGLLYHKILQKLFEKIKKEDRSFNASRLDIYKNWAMEITRTAIEDTPAFTGPLAVPLVLPQAAGMAKKIAYLLDLEAKYFDAYEIAALEFPVSQKSDELFINGVIDRVSLSPEGEPVIIDYKTGTLPDQAEYKFPEEVSLKEFQTPLYIKLYEESCVNAKKPLKVKGAYFYSINERRLKTAMGEEGRRGGTKIPNREEYEVFLEAADRQMDAFAKNVKSLDFRRRENRSKDCLACDYKTVCRSLYFSGGA